VAEKSLVVLFITASGNAPAAENEKGELVSPMMDELTQLQNPRVFESSS